MSAKKLYEVTVTMRHTICIEAYDADDALERTFEIPMSDPRWDNDEGDWEVEETYEETE
jgi:hypothetical protein